MKRIVLIIVICLVVGLCVALTACNKVKISLNKIEGDVSNVVIDSANHAASCSVAAETTSFDLKQLKFSSSASIKVAAYVDQELTTPIQEMDLAGGVNVFYIQVSAKKTSIVYTLTIDRHVHTFSEDWATDDDFHWHAATCEHTDLYRDKAVHNWVDDEVVVEATETVEGQLRQKCAVCQLTRIVSTGYASHVHTYDTDHWSSDEEFHWHAATCEHTELYVDKAEHAWGEPVVVTPATATQDGSKTYTCSVCGYVKTEAIQVLTSYPVELWGYEDGENRLLFSDHVAHGADYVFYHEPEERDGYDFVGWELASHDDETDAYTISFADVQLHTRQGKLIVNALYQQVYEVTFVDYNDGIFARAKVEAGDCVQAPQQEPARYGYDFDGWDFDFDTPITQDTAISALYTRLYQVTFCDQDGRALETKSVREGDAASYEAPELGGYEFEYWTDGTVDDQNVLVDAAQALAAVTDDLTVTAYYRVVGFTVRFFAKGNLLEEQIVNPCGFAIEPELPAQYQYAIDWDEYAGYAFSGWDTEFDLVTKDLDVTAQYETPIDEDTPIIAVKTDRYKEIVAEEISGALSINVSFVLIYDHDVRGLTIRVSQDSSLLVYSGYTLFPETQSFAQDNVEASISKDEVGDDVRYLEDVTWSSGSGSAIEIDEKKEILRIVYQINGVDAAKNEGDYWIMINDNTFIVNDELVRVTPIVISDFVRIVAQADELESIEE